MSTIEVIVTRESVAAGDDCDAPHEKRYRFPGEMSALEMLRIIVGDGYLADIQGGLATWSAVSGFPIAVIAQQWGDPAPVSWRELKLSDLPQSRGVVKIHFNYHAQVDPAITLEVLKRVRLTAP